ncbi:hypothetical protein L6Q96_05430 [Candidatus Binatia bacterium]|nr:hypothetical protein [Candidatus Binatia bacterium]
MKSAHLTDAQIRAIGWDALVDRLGYAGALRFSIQTGAGYGDYAAWRHKTLGGLRVDELLARVRASRKPRPRAKRKRR